MLLSNVFRARLRHAECCRTGVCAHSRCTDIRDVVHGCEEFISWKIQCRVKFETWAIIKLSFPTRDVKKKKKVRIIFRSNQSNKSNLAIYRAVARITLSISQRVRVMFLDVEQVCISMGFRRNIFHILIWFARLEKKWLNELIILPGSCQMTFCCRERKRKNICSEPLLLKLEEERNRRGLSWKWDHASRPLDSM